jgi:hypothetical protein
MLGCLAGWLVGLVCLFVCYLTTLSVSRLHSVDDRMITENIAVGGMRIGRENLPQRHFVHHKSHMT